MRKSFVLYMDALCVVRMLSKNDAGAVFKAIYEYIAEGTEPEGLRPGAAMAFSIFRTTLDRDAQKYEEACARKSIAGRKGAEVTNAKRREALPPEDDALLRYAEQCRKEKGCM